MAIDFDDMSAIFFKELEIPETKQLNIGKTVCF